MYRVDNEVPLGAGIVGWGVRVRDCFAFAYGGLSAGSGGAAVVIVITSS